MQAILSALGEQHSELAALLDPLDDAVWQRPTRCVDDFARIRVNGIVAGTWGSKTDPNAASFANNNTGGFDITSLLHSGTNTIVVKARNGPASFAVGCGPCTYQQNPAGVVFGGTVSYQP